MSPCKSEITARRVVECTPFRAGDLVIRNTDGIIVLVEYTTGTDDVYFRGIVVNEGRNPTSIIGRYSDSWYNSQFLPFNGTIKLSQTKER